MKQWDIFTWEFPGGSHPAVIVSHPARVTHKDSINVLYCTSQRAGRPPKEHEVLLDTADGLNWETLVRCDVLYLALKSELRQYRGTVIAERRRLIVRRIFENFGWSF